MAEWSTAYVNDLPDSAFLLIAPGGTKTGGRTDGAHRFFPVYDADGKLDEPHLANALARIPQASKLTPAQRATAMGKAKDLARRTNVSGPKGEYSGKAGSGRSTKPVEMLTRSFQVVMELRSDGDGRTVHGRAVPYDQTAEIGGGGRERFVMGAFARQISAGNVGAVKLHSSHSSRLSGEFPVGKTVHLSEQPDGLHGAWQIYDTARGDEALQLVRTGEVTGLSIGFKASPDGTRRGTDGAYERYAAHLDHVVLTGEPAYAGAQVTAIRSAGHPIGGYRTELIRARHIIDQVLSS